MDHYRIARRLGTVLLAASLVLASTSLSAGAAEDPDTFKDYVALGDSYTAGPLIPTQTPGPLGCFRSSDNYPAFLANYLGVRTFTDVSCSAARSEHLDESQRGNLPGGLPQNDNAPQKFALTEQTDLVTLGIGGNDYSLFGELIENCARLAEEDPDAETPCKDFFTEDGVDTKIEDAKRIQANIEKSLATIRQRAPEATVVVVNYLHILPETGTCDDVPFAEGDYRWGTTVQLELNASLREAARLYDADYVDMYAASVDRDACAGAEAWVNGEMIKPNALNYHPFRSGMKAIADTTFTQLTGEVAPAISLPALELRKRLPALIDLPGLLDYLAGGGFVPPGVIDDPELPDPDVPADSAEPGADANDDLPLPDTGGSPLGLLAEGSDPVAVGVCAQAPKRRSRAA